MKPLRYVIAIFFSFFFLGMMMKMNKYFCYYSFKTKKGRKKICYSQIWNIPTYT